MVKEIRDEFGVGDWLVEPSQGRISQGKTQVSIRPKVMELLVYLSQRKDTVVSHDELLETVWDGTIVTDSSLYHCMNLLREALGDDKNNPEYIETISKRGYRLIAPVKRIPKSEVGPQTSEGTTRGAADDASFLQSPRFKLIGVLAIVVSILVWILVYPKSPDPTSRVSAKPSIAVLPFKDMSKNGDQAYLADGIADELLSTLSREEGLNVIARTSSFVFADGKTSASEIGERLNVGHVLEGSVRRSGNRIRLTVQLIDTKSSAHLWSKSYTRELKDIFALEDEIVGEIHASLLEELLGERKIVETKPINPEAYDLYLLGMQDFRVHNFASIERAIVAFEKALLIEPDFPQAMLKLADALAFRITTGSHSDPAILERAEGLVNRVLANNPESGEAHYVLNIIFLNKDDYETAKQHIKQAYQLAPNNAQILAFYAYNLGYFGHELEEKQERNIYQRALKIDPLNSEIYLLYGIFLSKLTEHEGAEKAFRQAISLNLTNPINYIYLGQFYGNKLGDIVQAIPQFEQSAKLDPIDPDGPTYLSYAYHSLGDSEKALYYAEQAYDLMPKAGRVAAARVDALMLLGRKDAALELALESLNNAETFHRKGSKGRLVQQSISLMIDKGSFNEAEALLMAQYPPLEGLLKTNDPIKTGAQHYDERSGLALLAALYRAQGRGDEAVELASRLSLFNEQWYIENWKSLYGRSKYVMAFYGMGRLDDDKVIDYLEASIDGGYLLYWRKNIAQSPVFKSLHEHPRYIALIERTEAEMARQLAIVNAREVDE